MMIENILMEHLKPTVYIQSSGIQPRTKESLLKGKSAISREDIRWLQCNTKATSLLANTMYAQEAKRIDLKKQFFIVMEFVTEGSSSNVFIVKNDCILPTQKDQHILPGITREVVI